jgi:hypothetical protein
VDNQSYGKRENTPDSSRKRSRIPPCVENARPTSRLINKTRRFRRNVGGGPAEREGGSNLDHEQKEQERETVVVDKVDVSLLVCVVGFPFVCEGCVGRLENPSSASGPEKGGAISRACERERPKLFAQTLG